MQSKTLERGETQRRESKSRRNKLNKGKRTEEAREGGEVSERWNRRGVMETFQFKDWKDKRKIRRR